MKTDIKQKGLENTVSIKNNKNALSLYSNFSKSRKDNGQTQNRRPDLSYGANYSSKVKNSPLGEFTFNLNYKYTGNYTDWDGTKNSKQKSVDIVNLTLNKKILKNSISLDIKNLFDKYYEKPATYGQAGRRIGINFRKTY
jgi:outer membrane receptor protein involved in Fe transport